MLKIGSKCSCIAHTLRFFADFCPILHQKLAWREKPAYHSEFEPSNLVFMFTYEYNSIVNMNTKIKSRLIGRDREIKILRDCLRSKKPEFIAVYGRRRIGKTFLIKQFFKQEKVLFFDVSGEKDAPMANQIRHFIKQLANVFYSGANLAPPLNWDGALETLTHAIKAVDKKKKVVLFFDEFPWLVTRNSKLLQGLDYYWNQHWSNDNRIKLIICGSSASWIIDNIVNNKGGLHNRITQKIVLEPFNLANTKAFLKLNHIHLTNKQILDIYMSMGGVPYYLSQISSGLSGTQIIENLAFKKHGFLLDEFDNLFSSLFKDSEDITQLIKIIAQHRYGIGQRQLLEKTGKHLVGKGGLNKLKALKEAGFILDFVPLYHANKGIYYKLIDNYTLFYLYWIAPVNKALEKKGLAQGYWDKLKSKPAWHTWAGLAFESICYEHIPQIKRALGLSPTAMPSTWRYVPRQGSVEQGAQIDLLFDRDDDAITICEVKHSNKPYVITKDYAQKLKDRLKIFRNITRTKKQLFVAMISANGIKSNKYSEEILDGLVALEDLFKDEC